MPRCQTTNDKGNRCSRKAPSGEKWCYRCKEKLLRSLRGEGTPPRDLYGVPQNLHLTFEEFQKSEKPFELLAELALLRSFVAEYREAQKQTRERHYRSFAKDAGGIVESTLVQVKCPPEMAKKVGSAISSSVRGLLIDYFGPSTYLNVKDIEDLSALIERISKVTERAKKIQEGITLRVEIKREHLVRFLRECVLPNVHDPEARMRIAQSVRNFRLGKDTIGDDPLVRVVDADALPALKADFLGEKD